MEIHKCGEIWGLSCQENSCWLFELLLQLHNNSNFHPGFLQKVPDCAAKRFTRPLRQMVRSPEHMITSWIVSFLPYTYFFNISKVVQFPDTVLQPSVSLLISPQ